MCSLEDNILIVSDQIKHSGDGREPHEINDSCFVIRFPFSCFLPQMYIFIARICKSLGLLQGSMHMILWYILTCKHLNINNKKVCLLKLCHIPENPGEDFAHGSLTWPFWKAIWRQPWAVKNPQTGWGINAKVANAKASLKIKQHSFNWCCVVCLFFQG